MDEQQPSSLLGDTGQPVAAGSAPGGHPMEIWISHVLRAGVLTAGAIIALGLLFLLVEGPGPDDPTSLHDLQARGGRALAVHPSAVLSGALHGHATAIIQIGVLALILTPVVRVGMTIALFTLQRDRIFVLVTTVVFAILIVGLLGVVS